MRAWWILVAVGACKKEEPAGPPPPPPPPKPAVVVDAATPDAASKAALIDLTRGVPVEIMVSSQVQNPAILPKHLVDGDLNTAWNSKTNQLEGAWIDVDARDGSLISELRFTVGHTGHGKKGEDYFTMNPRIAKVAVYTNIDAQNEVQLGEYKLDIANRGLQTVAFTPRHQVRLEIVDIAPGSQKSWRETCVSELQAWGTPAKAVSDKPLVPTVTVYQPPPPPPGPCAGHEKELEEYRKRDEERGAYCAEHPDQCGIDSPGAPGCSTITATIDKIGSFPTKLYTECTSPDVHYAETTCTITDDDGRTYMSMSEGFRMDIEKITASPADGALALHVFTARGNEYLVVCRTDKCSDAIQVAKEDGRLEVSIQNGVYSTKVKSGDWPAEAIVTNQPLYK